MSEYPDIRWQQRFENFNKALTLMDEVYSQPIESYNDLAREGMIQRFEFTTELAWKVLQDYLREIGSPAELSAPKPVIRKAFAAGIITEGQLWIDMVELRNNLSHDYKMALFEAALPQIYEIYWPLLRGLREMLQTKISA